MVGTISDKGKKWIPRWWHTCVQREKLPTRTLSLPWEAFPFLDLHSEGLSNLASLDQTSFLLLYDRGKWKFFPRHEKFVLICILSLYTCMSPWRNYYSLWMELLSSLAWLCHFAIIYYVTFPRPGHGFVTTRSGIGPASSQLHQNLRQAQFRSRSRKVTKYIPYFLK